MLVHASYLPLVLDLTCTCVIRQSDTPHKHLVAIGVKLYEWFPSLDAYTLHSLTEVLELEVSARYRTLKLLVIVFKVDSLVVV